MINPGLNLPFRWYADIDQQNRYKENCSATCDFRLISTVDKPLPFQVRTEITSDRSPELYALRLMCPDGVMAVDLSALLGLISLDIIDGVYYVTYDASAVISLGLECGLYYLELELQETDAPLVVTKFYSELFSIIDFTETIDTEQLPLFTAWRWYDNIDKQTRYKGNCSATCDYYIISGNDALLPFQFKTDLSVLIINSFKLVAVDGSCERILDINLLSIEVFSFVYYIVYDGTPILDLECGSFYGVINATVDDGGGEFDMDFFSELIKLVQITEVDPTPDSDYLLQETGFKILQETGFGILLE